MKVLIILVQLCTNLFQLFFHRLTQRNLDFLVHPLLVAFLSSFAPQMFKTQTEAMLRVCTADRRSSAHSPAPQEHSEMKKKKKKGSGKVFGGSLFLFFFFPLGNLSEAEVIGLRETSFQHKLCSDGFQLELT